MRMSLLMSRASSALTFRLKREVHLLVRLLLKCFGFVECTKLLACYTPAGCVDSRI